MEKIGAVILAAGGSSRLGQPKQFLSHRGKAMIERAADAAIECSPVVVVAGRDRQRIEQELRTRHVTVVDHQEWESGIGSSIRAGVKCSLELAPNLDALIILVCDQPYVTSDIIEALRITHQTERKPIVASRYANGLGVPALFDSLFFADLLSLPCDCGAKHIISRAENAVSQIEFPEGAINIDTAADSIRHLDAERLTHGCASKRRDLHQKGRP